MKQRLTYLLRDPKEFSLSQVRVTTESTSVEALDAAKEQHLTFGFDELPQEIWRVLKQCHELHIRWASTKSAEAIPPFLSRVSPGLHAFFTPHRGTSADLLCPLLKKAFSNDLRCESPESTFIVQPILSERFSSSSSSSYYQVLPSLEYLVTYLQQKLCATGDSGCQDEVAALQTAKSVDIDFDTISHAVIVRAHWDSPASRGGWTETATLRRGSGPLEVGILNNETPDEPEELKLGGFLTVVGSDNEPKATLFSFPARYHPLPSDRRTVYSTSFTQPTGLHPTLEIRFPSNPAPPRQGCALHAYLTLPSYLFIDKYQFNDDLFLASHHLRQLRSISGETDLEAPDWVIEKWGSSALFELADISTQKRMDEPWKVTVPLHLRYLSPVHNSSGIASVDVPWPVVFWACEAEEGLKMSNSPFDRVNLGYDGLFGPKTMFYPISTRPDSHLAETLQVPVLDLDRAGWVEIGTIAAISVGTLWICWKLLSTVLGGRHDEAPNYKKTK